jgi:hypothetical protein
MSWNSLSNLRWNCHLGFGQTSNTGFGTTNNANPGGGLFGGNTGGFGANTGGTFCPVPDLADTCSGVVEQCQARPGLPGSEPSISIIDFCPSWISFLA